MKILDSLKNMWHSAILGIRYNIEDAVAPVPDSLLNAPAPASPEPTPTHVNVNVPTHVNVNVPKPYVTITNDTAARVRAPKSTAKVTAKSASRAKLVDLTAAAEILKLSPNTFRNYRSAGRLAISSIETNDGVRFARADVVAEAKRRALKKAA